MNLVKSIILSGPLLVLIFLFTASPKVCATSLSINHLNEVTHIEIPDISAADYEIKMNEASMVLNVEALSPASQKKLTDYSDRYIKKIEIKKSTNLSKDIVTFYFNEDNIELFDYLTDAPSALSIDLFSKNEDEVNQAELELDKQQNLKKKNEKKKEDSKNLQRSLASAEFIKSIGHVTIDGDTKDVKKEVENAKELEKKKRETNRELLKIVRLAKMDEQDLLRFDADRLNFSKDSLIEGKNNIYIKYPPLISEHDFLKDILEKNVRYEFPQGEDGASKDFYKINKLFVRGDYKDFLKAKKIFTKKHKDSKFEEMLSHMEAESYLKLYETDKERVFFDKAMSVYDAILIRYPKSSVSERTLLLIAYLRLKDKNYFDSARNLKLYVKRYSTSPLRENVELLLAQTLIYLQQFEDSRALYTSLLSSNSEDIKSRAQYELGDIYFQQKNYEKAKESYLEALKKYPSYEKVYTNIYFNLGEAEFLTGNYKESLNFLRKFIQIHSTHEHASFAWTRMGEIFEMSQVEEKIWKGYFNEAYFRFQNKTGGIIAHINLLFHQAIKAPKEKIEHIIDQIKSYESKLHLPQSDEYIHFKVADIYYQEGQYGKSLQTLTDHFKNGQIPHHAEKFHRRIGRSIVANLRSLIDNNKIEEGIKIFDTVDSVWFKKSDRFDYSYYKGELFYKAKNFAKAYNEYEKYLTDLKKSQEAKEVDGVVRLPLINDIKLRMADCAFKTNKMEDLRKNLKEISVKDLSAEGADEYALLMAQLSKYDGRLEDSRNHLQKITNHTDESSLLLVDTILKLNKPKEAISSIDSFIEKNDKNEKQRFYLLKKKLEILESYDSKKFQDFLGRFYSEYKDKNYDIDREKYLFGKILLKSKKEKEAQDVLSKISKDSYWAKLASELEAEEQWNQKYQKYIERIPAMENNKEKK